jgi:hypothetical protein
MLPASHHLADRSRIAESRLARHLDVNRWMARRQ